MKEKILCFLVMAVLVLGGFGASEGFIAMGKKPVKPKTSAEAKKQQAAAQKEIQLTQEQIKQNEAKVKKVLNELGKLDLEIEQTQGKIRDLKVRLNELNSEISGLEVNIGKNETELQRLRDEYLKAVKRMRVTKKNKSTLAFIFSSKNMREAMRRMRYLKEFSAWRERQSDEINDKLSVLKQEKEALTIAKEEQQGALAMQKNNEATLSLQHEKQSGLVAELKQNGKFLESHLKQKQAEARELGGMISNLIAQEEKEKRENERREREAREKEAREREAREKQQLENASKTETLAQEVSRKDKNKRKTDKNTYADARKRKPRGEKETGKLNSTTVKAESGFEGMRGKLPSPSTGSFIITSRFGRQSLPDLPDVEFDNPGIDAESEIGASARAVYEGKVSGVYLLPGYNTVVIVNHGNYYTVYGNISTPNVKTGDAVTAGSSLGPLALSEDNSGHSSIHFEVWKNREKLNPQDWLR